MPQDDTKELAEGYTLVNDTQYSAGLFLLNRLQIRPGMHVLDVGCGPGNLTAHLAYLVGPNGSVVGIDPSAERIRLALTSHGHRPNLSFEEGIAEDLSRFDSARFDAVFVNSTLHWVRDQPAALCEFGRVLRPGGRLGISGGSGDFEAVHERIKAEVLGRAPYRDYPDESSLPRFLKRMEIEDLLDAAGFGEREIVVNSIVREAKDGEAMIDWLDTSSSGKTYGGIPLEMRPRAREEMKVEWAKVTTVEGIKMDMELLVTVAVMK
ncbi:trans-aconitate 2-methyltransferase [Staphylotrichum tortipilum]|uniref:Trans-aconitate 2-methyltransferase n=1 Tax=Staphylotrichum tortipilum TaxID=2831512 RepID=A0AAN6MUZ3_9PEZI|nr:trans-aconitate 2-methyltransferase [Staphylotrichum longicolle]